MNTAHSNEYRIGRAFLIGGIIGLALTTIIPFIWRNKSTIIVGCCLYWAYVHFVTQQTADLRSYIDQQYQQISVTVLNAEQRDPHNTAAEADTDNMVTRMTVSVHNTSQGGAYRVYFRCTGHTTYTPPDSSYEPEVKPASAPFDLPYAYIGAGETKQFTINAMQYKIFAADPSSIACHATGALFEDSDFYKAKKQMDRWGIAGIDTHVSTIIDEKPIHYLGMDYSVRAKGTITNHGRSAISSFRVQCFTNETARDGDYSEDFNTPIPVGGKATFATHRLQIDDHHPAENAFCRVSSIVQPWFYQ